MFSDHISQQCAHACTYMDITFGYPFIYEIASDAVSSITLYFKTSVALRENHIAYDVASLFAEIGGYSGLLLGVSVFDVLAKPLNFLSQKIKASFCRNKNGNDLDNVLPH